MDKLLAGDPYSEMEFLGVREIDKWPIDGLVHCIVAR